jgi:hypothetical protein
LRKGRAPGRVFSIHFSRLLAGGVAPNPVKGDLVAGRATGPVPKPSLSAMRESLRMLFAYFTPETALPVASVIAATFGFFMLTGRSAIRFVTSGVRRVIEKLNL